MNKGRPVQISYKFKSHLQKPEKKNIYIDVQKILGTIMKISDTMATWCLGFVQTRKKGFEHMDNQNN
jgi:hypothetical protein